jgi:hypothetical protein
MKIAKKDRVNAKVNRASDFNWLAIYPDGGERPVRGETNLEKDLNERTDLFKELKTFIATPGVVDKTTEEDLLRKLSLLLNRLGQWHRLNRKQRRMLDKEYRNYLTTIRLAMRKRK